MDNENTTPTAEETAAPAAKDEAAEASEKASEKPAENTESGESPKPEKTFTQAEVDKMIEKRLARERSSAENKADKALSEITALKNANACYKAGIKDECIDDAVTLAAKLTDDKTDFSAALKKVVEKYPQFVKGGSSAGGITTGTKTSNSSDSSDKALRAAFGLK